MIRFLLLVIIIFIQTIGYARTEALFSPIEIQSNDSILKANVFVKEGNYDSAISIYKTLLKKDSTSYETLFGLARALAFSGEREQSLEIYSRLLSIYPNDPDALLGRGRVFAWEEQFEKSERDLRQVVNNYPDYEDAWSALADLYLWWNKHKESLEALEHQSRLNPSNPEIYIKKARVYRSLRQFYTARAELINALELGGDKSIINQFLRDLARLPGATLWSVMLSYDYENFTPKRDNWITYNCYIKREFSFGTIILGGYKTFRFGKWDQALLLDSYFNLWRKAYGNWSYQAAMNREFLPQNTFRIEIYQGVFQGWEISGSFGRMNFPANKVDLYSSMIAKYIGGWYVRSRILLVPNSDNTDISYSVAIRRYLGSVDDFIDLVYGWSALPGELFTEEDIKRVQATSTRIRLEKTLRNYLILFVQASYRNDEKSYYAITRAFTLGLTYRW